MIIYTNRFAIYAFTAFLAIAFALSVVAFSGGEHFPDNPITFLLLALHATTFVMIVSKHAKVLLFIRLSALAFLVTNARMLYISFSEHWPFFERSMFYISFFVFLIYLVFAHKFVREKVTPLTHN